MSINVKIISFIERKKYNISKRGGYMQRIDASAKQNEVIPLNATDSLIINILHDKDYAYNIVTFVSGNKQMYIGQYCSFNYDYSTEWVEYNDDFIVFLSHINSGANSEYEVYHIFDIKNKCSIKAVPSELLRIYEEEIKGKAKIK